MLEIDLCKKIIGGPAGFWEKADEAWNALSQLPAFMKLHGSLHDVLIFQHASAKGSLVLRQMQTLLRKLESPFEGIFPACALGSLLPEALCYYKLLGVPDSVSQNTFADMTRWIERYRQTHCGELGIDELGWITGAFAGTLFEFGALQFQTIQSHFSFYAWETEQNITVVPQAGLSITKDGHLLGTNARSMPAAFTTVLELGVNSVAGNRIDCQNALIEPTLQEIHIGHATLLLAPGMPIVNLHIPGGTDLSPPSIRRSFIEAAAFFKSLRYPFNAVICASWLLDPALKSLLPPTGNIAQFAENFTCFPVYSDHYYGEQFLFPARFSAQASAPLTTLQKNVRAFQSQGKELFDTGGIVLSKSFVG